MYVSDKRIKKDTKYKIMKKLQLSTLLLLLTIASIFYACDKKSDEEKYTDYFKIGDKVLQMSTGAMFYKETPSINVETETEYYRNEVVLFGNTGDLSITTEDVSFLEGSGDFIDMEFISTTPTFESGVYTFTGDDSDLTPFNIYAGGVYINFNVETREGEAYEMTEGTMTVTHEGDLFNVSLNGKVYPVLRDSNGDITGPDLSKPSRTISTKFNSLIDYYVKAH
jgi:hypothetical protein